jgi:hypothetical protein
LRSTLEYHTKLKGNELEVLVLLKAKGVVSSKQGQGNLANKKDLYQKFITGERVAVNHEPWTWTETDDAKLQALRLRAEPIDLADTAYGRFLNTKKKDATRVYGEMSEERCLKRRGQHSSKELQPLMRNPILPILHVTWKT